MWMVTVQTTWCPCQWGVSAMPPGQGITLVCPSQDVNPIEHNVMHWISVYVGGIPTPDTSYITAAWVIEHSTMCCVTFDCFYVLLLSKLSSGIVVVITDTDILPTPISHIWLCTCFEVDSQTYCLWHGQSDPLPIMFWSLLACIMSTSFVTKLWNTMSSFFFFW